MAKPILAAMLSCAGTELTDEEKYLFAEYNPLGISLFARNIKNKKQVIKLVEDIKNTINRDDVLIAVDEEGGRVSHIEKVVKLAHKPNQGFVSGEELGNAAVKYSKIQAILIAEKMKELGLNVNYAPVVDRKEKKQSLVLQSRCFSSDKRKIISRTKAMVEAYIDMGICPCIKHLPGHFDTMTDPHLSLPAVDINKEKIEKKIAYMQQFSDYPLAMTAHVLLKDIDNQFPVTMSKICIEKIIRGYLGCKSFLISDAIDMHALKGSVVERAENCWNAGIDAICYCFGKYDEMYQICHQKRFMTEKAQNRFANIKKIIHNTPKDIKTSALEKMYSQEFQGKRAQTYAYDATEVLHQMLKKGEKI